jgi:hypothetical protein
MSIMITEIDDIVNFYTPEIVEQTARETGFVERESKFGGIEFMGIMTAGLFAEPDASLNRMSAMAKDINPEVEISGPGIHQRIDETGVAFLKELLSKCLELSTSKEIDESIPGLLGSFERICLLDSTVIPLPDSLSAIWRGSGGDGPEASMKFQLMLDHKSGEYVNVAPTDGVTPDQSYITEAVKLLDNGDLVIFDLGYSKKKALFDVSDAGAYFVSRLNHQLSLYKEDENGTLTKLDLVKKLKKEEKKETRACELEVWFSEGESRLKVRVIAERVPDSVANERRRKIRQKAKKRGYTPSGKYLYLQGWSLYITNAREEILPAESVSLVYGIRWQIELVFKAWKSYHGLTQLKGKRQERIECFIYGRLIMMVIMAFLSGSIRRYLWRTRKRDLSFLKAVRHFKLKASKALSFIANPVSFAEFLKDEFLEACRLCMMDSRRRLSTAGKIRMANAALL